MKALREAAGDTAAVAQLHGEGASKRRVMDMGVTKALCVRKAAPLGDPAEAAVRGYEISLRGGRRNDSNRIETGETSFFIDRQLDASN